VTTVQTPVEKLPSWKGRPVPWVARWSGEQVAEPATVGMGPDGTLVVYYKDGNELRDESGILWIREKVDRSGTPQYAQVSAMRQRSCMRYGLCQVCGEKIETPVVRWLIDPRQIVQREGTTLTYSPPTCDGCVELSLTLCPAMKKKHAIVRVLEYEVWGVSASVVRLNDDGRAEETKEGLIDPRRTDLPFKFTQVVARQQVVVWKKWMVET
jgi:hypothetical protein